MVHSVCILWMHYSNPKKTNRNGSNFRIIKVIFLSPYRNDPKFTDIHIRANSVDPDQTAHEGTV